MSVELRDCPFCHKPAVFVGVHDNEGNYKGVPGCEYESDPWSGLSYGLHHKGWGECVLCTCGEAEVMGGVLFDTAEQAARYWNSGGNLMNKKAMISQPMNGKTDKEILAVRNQAVNTLTQMGYQFVNSLFEDDGKEEYWFTPDALKKRGIENIPLCYLARSLEVMAQCHAVYFCKGWDQARGCRLEHDSAVAYGMEVLYEDGAAQEVQG